MKNAGFRNKEVINTFMNNFLKDGYNVRMFDPAGQDDIGGGCGQLWYVQQWYKNKKG
jgi:23S rRNA (adenine2503-C2)-methyltransferase